MRKQMDRRFSFVAVGGTFDEFHKGHIALLAKAFEVGDRVLIGLSSDEFAKKLKKPHMIADYEHRLKDLKEFLEQRGLAQRAQVIRLDNVYGPTLSEGSTEALIVSRETEPTSAEINEKRRKRGLPQLEIVVIDMVPSQNHAPVSTTRIRRGEIDREGRLLR